jgi:hypothetical protein
VDRLIEQFEQFRPKNIMTKSIVRTGILGLLALAVAALPMQLVAQTSTNSTPPPKRSPGHPFRGKLAAVDKEAKTIKVGETTYQITSKTKILKAGSPATLEDGVVGEDVGGYAREEDGKMVATTVRFGRRPEKKADAPATAPEPAPAPK